MTTRAGGDIGLIAGGDSLAETEPRTETKAASARTWFRYALPGAWVALVFASSSFTPSLLPRSALSQGVLCGVTASIGYGLGVVGAWVWREFANRDARPAGRRSWRIFVVAGTVLVVVSLLLGQRWQGQLRDLVGAPADSPFRVVITPIAAAVVFAFTIALGRGLRWVYRWVARQLSRWIGPRAARATGLGSCCHDHGPAGQRCAGRRGDLVGGPQLRTPRHDHPGGGRAAEQSAPLREPEFADRVGLPRPPRPHLHRERSDG